MIIQMSESSIIFFSSPQCLKMIWKASKSIGNHLFEALMSGSWVDGLAQLGVAVA